MMINDPACVPDEGPIEPPGAAARMVRVILGVYLLPVVLVVLAVAAVGLVVLTIGRLAIRATRAISPSHAVGLPSRPARLTN